MVNEREEISLDNPALFRGKDVGFVGEVVSYLRQHDLNPVLEGSAKHNAERGNPRVYGDIDIVGCRPGRKINEKGRGAEEGVARLVRNDSNYETTDEGDMDKLFGESAKKVIGKEGRAREWKAQEAVARLMRADSGLEPFNDWEVEDVGSPRELYVGRVVDHRFKIRSPKTNTVIELHSCL